MTYETEKTDNYSGTKTLVIKKNIVDDVMYPPDYFLKRAAAKVKDLAKDVVTLAPRGASPAVALFAKKPEVKTAVGKVAATGLKATGAGQAAVLATVVPTKVAQQKIEEKKIAEIDKKLSSSGAPVLTVKPPIEPISNAVINPAKLGAPQVKPVDIVSSVSGIKATPVVKPSPPSAPLRETIVTAVEKIPTPLREVLKEQGNELIDRGVAKLSDDQKALLDFGTNAGLLPKTRAVKEAERVLTAPVETVQRLQA